jgi:phosphoesterase RecJ-like protein
MIRAETIKKLKKILRVNQRFIILSHVNPEPDTIGAALSFYHYLKALGKKVSVYNADGVPSFMRFMKHSEIIKTSIPDRNFDVAICVDAGSTDMLGEHFDALKKNITVNIDHHRTNTMYGDLNIVDPDSSAACELTYTLFERVGIPIDRTVAALLLAGIIYDTGSFRYRNTTCKTLKVAAELIKLGADIGGISEKLYENQSLGRLKLLKTVLDTLELSSNGRIASVELTKNMYEATRTTKEDSEGMIDYPKSISGVVVAVLFREVEDEKYKISLRSKNDVNVSDIAEEFGGGGHKNAAGCTMEGLLFDVKNKIFAKIVERLKN